jgi:hypothetical protein
VEALLKNKLLEHYLRPDRGRADQPISERDAFPIISKWAGYFVCQQLFKVIGDFF